MTTQPYGPIGPADEMHAERRELVAILERYSRIDGFHQTAIPGFNIYRASAPGASIHSVYKPALALLAQGAKRVILADEVFDYDPTRYLLTSMNLPVIHHVTRASVDAPYLCVVFDLDLRKVAELIGEMRLPLSKGPIDARAMAVGLQTSPLLNAVLRLARLLDAPQDIPLLAPLIEREVLYRLLTGDLGTRLRHIGATGSQPRQIARVIEQLEHGFAAPLSIEALARSANMSKSSLHNHFKTLTAMTPLQYQKQLRLQEARRLMLVEFQDAASAGLRVGYESPSQFSREYARLFGAPPLRDIARLRERRAQLA